MSTAHIWLRAETKPGEQRSSLTPAGAGSLLDAGFRVTVEDCPLRIFPTDDYRALSCDIAEPGTWRDAPHDAFILGLKELPDDTFPLEHRHIYFAHVYKDQAGAEATLNRFVRGRGRLYDLEYLTDENGRRVAAFGYWAGFCGAALGVMAWANKEAGDATPLGKLESRPSKDVLLDDVSVSLARPLRGRWSWSSVPRAGAATAPSSWPARWSSRPSSRTSRKRRKAGLSRKSMTRISSLTACSSTARCRRSSRSNRWQGNAACR